MGIGQILSTARTPWFPSINTPLAQGGSQPQPLIVVVGDPVIVQIQSDAPVEARRVLIQGLQSGVGQGRQCLGIRRMQVR
jgi:hypothetical protein